MWLSLGVGVEHDTLVKLASQSFAKNPIWLEDVASLQKPMERDLSMAQYTGGKVEVWASHCSGNTETLHAFAIKSISDS